jgi:hypothetical protein
MRKFIGALSLVTLIAAPTLTLPAGAPRCPRSAPRSATMARDRRQFSITNSATFSDEVHVMSDVACNAANPEAGRVSQVKRSLQVKRFSVAAVPATGFVHGAIGRHRVDALELHSEYLQAKSQDDPLLKVLDYCTAGFVIVAVVFGPGLAWLLLT